MSSVNCMGIFFRILKYYSVPWKCLKVTRTFTRKYSQHHYHLNPNASGSRRQAGVVICFRSYHSFVWRILGESGDTPADP